MQKVSFMAFFAVYQTDEQKATTPLTYGSQHDVVCQ